MLCNPFHVYKTLEVTNSSLVTKCRFSGGLENGKVWDRESTKEFGETFEDDRYVHYLDCVDGVLSVERCQNLSDCTLKVCLVYRTLIIPQLSCYKEKKTASTLDLNGDLGK